MGKKFALDADRAAVQKRMEAGEEIDAKEVWRSTETGSRSWAKDVLKRWHREGKVYISRWERGQQGEPAPFYKWGAGKDAKRPNPLGSAAASRKWRKNNPDKVAIGAARAIFRRRTTPILDPIHAAMCGYKRQGNAWIKKDETHTHSADS